MDIEFCLLDLPNDILSIIVNKIINSVKDDIYLTHINDEFVTNNIGNFITTPKDKNIIKDRTESILDIVNIKKTCKTFNNLITNFTLKQLKISNSLCNCKKLRSCANVRCYYDTDFIENSRYRHYTHYHQDALNYILVYLSADKFFKTNMPYCFECMKMYSYIIYSKKDYRLIKVEDESLTITMHGWKILPENRTYFV